MTQSPRIAIIGAGPGGLTLARILQQNGIATTIFEREAHARERPQGGTLDLHVDSGQYAIECAGLKKEFLSVARYEDQGDRLYDKAGHLLYANDDAAAQGDRPEVDRTALRDLLLDSVAAHSVQWGKTLQQVRPREDGAWDLVFEGETSGPFDLVVGADGTWSRVRPLVSRYQPIYTGLTFIEFGIDDVDNRHPAISKLVGLGKMGVEGDGRGLIVQRNANAHLRGYAIFRVPTDWAEATFPFKSPAAVRARLELEFSDWAPVFIELIRASNDVIVQRPIHALPVGHHWPNRIGITLIGDAAHVMSPFGGEGVNAAMLDAAELARYLLQTADWREAVHIAEEAMFERVLEPATHAAQAAATELSHVGQELMLAHLKARSHLTE